MDFQTSVGVARRLEVHFESFLRRKFQVGLSAIMAWVPYLMVAILLVLSRLDELPLKSWLGFVSFKDESVFGTGVGISSKPLYLPGFLFVVVSLLTWWLHRIPAAKYAQAWKVSGKTLLSAAVVLFWAVPMVQLLINSGGGGQGFDSIPQTMATTVAGIAGSSWTCFSPWLGGLGGIHRRQQYHQQYDVRGFSI